MTIAQTIIQQLGRACLGLLGAHTLVDLKDGVRGVGHEVAIQDKVADDRNPHVLKA